jgi:hypothetical protein
MSVDAERNVGLEISHILFVDIVGYSKLSSNEQRRQLELLNGIVRATEQFRTAQAAGVDVLHDNKKIVASLAPEDGK